MMIDSNFRKNCSQICLWKSENQKEINNYIEELSGTLGRTRQEQKENFLDLYEFATEEPHSFLYINYHQPKKENKFHRNFDEILRFDDECSSDESQYETDSDEETEYETDNEIEEI